MIINYIFVNYIRNEFLFNYEYLLYIYNILYLIFELQKYSDILKDILW